MRISSLFLCLVVGLLVTCCNNDVTSDKAVSKPATLIKQKHYCNDSLITKEILKKATYKEAIKNCNLTIIDRELALNEIVPFGIRIKFKTIFSEEELRSDTKFKEVKWESKDLDYIIVWYLEEEGVWKPFDLLKIGKEIRF